MPSKIYDTAIIELIDGTELYITPLKIKYLREFMDRFADMSKPNRKEESMDILLDCARIAMKQYHPIVKTVEDVEDGMDISTMYKILEIAGGIKLDSPAEENEPNEDIKKESKKQSGTAWNDFDIAKLESELFLLGIWKDYEELETSLSLPELTETLNAKREYEYQEKKFLAAMQGVDLDEQSGKDNEWEAMKARVATKGKVSDPNDIVSFQGVKAQQTGFGIGMGLQYEQM